MTRTNFVGAFVLGLAVILAAGATPGCSCNSDNGGQGGNGDGGMNGDGGVNSLTACADNDPSCTVVCLGPTCMPPTPFPMPTDPNPNAGADGVTTQPGTGYIILDQGHAAFDYLWISNDVQWGDGTVSKLSTKPRTTPYPNGNVYGEVARYATVTCMSDLVNGSNEGAVFSAANAQTLCADGVHGCCARDESNHPGAGLHQPINLKTNRPSRTAVDFNGDMWVANRAFGLQSSVTKIANDITECIDRNKNGKIDTSEDVNQDGIITTDCNGDNIADNLATVCTNGLSRPEFLGYDDECVLFTTNTGNNNQYGRPLTLGPGAIDFGPADAWAGTWKDGTFYRVDGATGKIKQTVKIADEQGVKSYPYGAAIDAFGILWAPNEAQTHLFYFDTTAVDPNAPSAQGMVSVPAALGPGVGFYGIAIDGYTDANGNLVQQVWMGNVGESGAYRYRPVRTNFASLAGGTWARALYPAGTASQGRGIGVDNRKPTSFAWVALDGYVNSVAGGIGRIPINIADNAVTTMTTADFFHSDNQHGTLGAGVALDLDIWGINQSEGSAMHLKVDATGNVLNAAKPDTIPLEDRPAAAENACALPCAQGAINEGTCTMQCKVHPYTYSDFTGFGLRNFTNPHGTYSWLQTGCGPGKTKWLKVVWDADIPAGTSIEMRARSSDDQLTIGQAMFTGGYPSNPGGGLSVADLSQPPGPVMPNPSGFLQVEFDLTTTDKNTTPALKSFTVVYECIGSIN
jgi:hypothetical protein